MDFISNTAAIIILIWLFGAVITSILAKSKNRSFFQWLLIGLIFGFGGIILVLIITRNDKKQYKVPSKDEIDRKLWYNKMKSEMENSKSVNN